MYQLDKQGRRRLRAYSVNQIMLEVNDEDVIYSLKSVVQGIASKIRNRVAVKAVEQLHDYFPTFPYPVVKCIMSHLDLYGELMISSQEGFFLQGLCLCLCDIYNYFKGAIFNVFTFTSHEDLSKRIIRLIKMSQGYTSYIARNRISSVKLNDITL